MPSDTVYGLVASALCPDAVDALVGQARQAYARLPLAASAGGSVSRSGIPVGSLGLSVRSAEATGDFVLPVTNLTRRLRERCFPGPLTLVADCREPGSAVERLPESVQHHLVEAATGGVGETEAGRDGEIAKWVTIRVADHRILSHIHRYLAAPLVWAELPAAGSTDDSELVANQPIARAITSADGLKAVLELGKVDSDLPWPPLLLDDGITRYGGWGTVVRAVGRTWTVVRDGVIQRAAMNQFAKPVIAIVCTGNTCRSPMAETLLRSLLLERFGREDVAQVVSAGLAAGRGGGATPQAIEVMGRHGLDLTGHCSRPLDDSLMTMADLVLTMTRRHREAILAAWPDRSERVFTLRRDGGDVGDPVGMPVDVYFQCAEQIRQELNAWVDSLGESFFPVEAPEVDLNRHNNETSATTIPSEADATEPTDADFDNHAEQDAGDGPGPTDRPDL